MADLILGCLSALLPAITVFYLRYREKRSVINKAEKKLGDPYA